MNGAGNIDLNTILGLYAVPVFIAAAFVYIIYACYCYKLLRFSLVLAFSAIFGVAGAFVTEMFVPAVAGINVSAAVGVVCAIIGALVGKNLFKFCVFVVGAALGFVVGMVLPTFLPNVEFLQNPTILLIVAAVCALVVGILSIFLFKALYIIINCVGGVAVAGAMVGAALTDGVEFITDPATGALSIATPGNNMTFILAGAVLGLIAGIVIAVNQFKNSYDY